VRRGDDGGATIGGVVREPQDADYAGWVVLLADPARAQRAYWHLVLSGPGALDAIRHGLSSPVDDVRRFCTKALDHLVDEVSFPMLVALLNDSDAQVRVEAIHALACDRCKDNACRPAASVVLPRAIEALLMDSDRHVRSRACELVGRWVHSYQEAADALIRARDTDQAPAVRKKAGWYAPGGAIHRKTAPGVDVGVRTRTRE
jgi:HEAT repeat protein